MGRIRVDTDALRNYTGTLNGRISEYEALTARLEALNANIQASWRGNSKDAFGAMMAGYMDQAKNLEEILSAFRNYVQNAADQFETVDAECASRIRSVF